MSYIIDLEEGESRLYQDFADDPNHPMSFGITDRAVFMMREQYLRVDKYYMHRVPRDSIKEIVLKRERGPRAWLLGGISATFGLIASLALFANYWWYGVSTKQSPMAVGGAAAFLLIGLIMIFDSRWRFTLLIETTAKRLRWRPSIFAKREEARRLQESFLTYCRYFSIPTRRIDITNRRENEDFWKWFRSRSRNITSNEIQKRLSRLADGLVVDISNGNNLTISADYKKDLFPVVQDLIDVMPEIPSWKIAAFHKRRNLSKTFVHNEQTHSLEDFYFVPYSDGFSLALVVYGPFDEALPETFEAGMNLIKQLLGEYDFTLFLESVYLEPSSDKVKMDDVIAIIDLPEYFDDFMSFDDSTSPIVRTSFNGN